MRGGPSFSWRMPRKHPRVPLVTQLESRASGATSLGRTENISVGGLLVLCRDIFQAKSEVVVRFNLPSGQHVEAIGVVAHVKPGRQMGIQFLQMKEEDRKALTEFVREIKPYTRRSVRLARRLAVVLRWQDYQGNAHEEAAETALLSRHGGLLLTQTSFKPGTDAFLWWPEQERGARVRIIYRRLGGATNLAEVGFEFVGVDNFWGIEFPRDPMVW